MATILPKNFSPTLKYQVAKVIEKHLEKDEHGEIKKDKDRIRYQEGWDDYRIFSNYYSDKSEGVREYYIAIIRKEFHGELVRGTASTDDVETDLKSIVACLEEVAVRIETAATRSENAATECQKISGDLVRLITNLTARISAIEGTNALIVQKLGGQKPSVISVNGSRQHSAVSP